MIAERNEMKWNEIEYFNCGSMEKNFDCKIWGGRGVWEERGVISER